MWYIKKLESYAASLLSYRPISYCTVTNAFLDSWKLRLHLANTKTGKTQLLDSEKVGCEVFKRVIENVKPYGVANGGEFSTMLESSYVFMSIDSFSLMLLDYVDSVKVIKQNRGDECYDLLAGCRPYANIDKHSTLFTAYEDGQSFFCTLLHIMCYRPQNWVGDTFIFSGQNWGRADDSGALYGYQVIFNDVRLAQRCVTKAVVSGVNPIQVMMDSK